MLYVTQDQRKINVTRKANEDKLIIKVKDMELVCQKTKKPYAEQISF
jgi:hypothetical protein